MGLRPLWTTMSSYSSWGQRGQAEGLRQLPPCPLPKFSHPPWEPGAASKPEVPAPESESQLLVLSPPPSRPSVFSRPCGLSSPSAATGSLPLCLYPNPSAPANQRQPLPTAASRCLGSPVKPLHRWLRSFPTAASVQITAAQGHLPAACVLLVLLPPPKNSSHGHPLLPVYQPLWPRSYLSLCLSSASATAFTSPPPVPEFSPPPLSRSPLTSPARLPELSNQSSPSVSRSQ